MKKLIKLILSKLKGNETRADIRVQPSLYQSQNLVNGHLNDLLKAYKDRIDTGFEIDPSNLYHKFIDENQYGTKKYNDLV